MNLWAILQLRLLPPNSLIQSVSSLSNEPGVYQFFDNAGIVIYVGKAKNLKRRVSSYFVARQDRDIKTRFLVSRVVRLETIVTSTEEDALILERQLIKTLQPRFNLALKDDKSYPYIKITRQDPFPRLLIVRERLADKAVYFGPYPSVGSSRYLLRLLHDMFPLRDCKMPIDLVKLQPKCMKLDLGKCLGPCVIKSVKPEYDRIVDDLCMFLVGKRQQLLGQLTKRMWDFSDQHAFEKAARLRDSIDKLTQLLQRQQVQLSDLATVQVWVMVAHDVTRYALVQCYVDGKLLYQNGFYAAVEEESESSFLERAVIHFSATENPSWQTPNYRLSDSHFAAVLEAYSETETAAIDVLVPQRGEKKLVVDVATRNATLALSRLVPSSGSDPLGPLLSDIQVTLGLPRLPERIWGVDISHFGATEIVGVVVCFVHGKPFKAGYRKFIIRTVSGKSDDPASIYEVVSRRLLRVIEDGEDWPDLILIDGGRGQLNFALAAAKDAGMENLPIVSLAKRDEMLYFPNRLKPLKLYDHHPVLHVMQRLRDESHRFAVSFQRSRRKLVQKDD